MSLESQLRSTNRAASTAIEASLPKALKAKPEPTAKTEAAKPATNGAAKPEPKQEGKPKPEAPAKKAATAANASSNGRSRYADDAVITVKSTEHGKRGNRAMVLDAMKSGMSVEKYKAALAKKEHPGMFGWAMKFAIENKLISVK